MSVKLYRNILLSVSVVILLAILWLSNPLQIYSTLITGRIEFVVLALMVTTFTALLRVFKWSFLLRTKFLGLVPVQFLGISMSMITPGRIAEPTKALLLKLKDGTPVSRSLPSIIWERVLDVIAIVIFAVFATAVLANTQYALLGYIGMALFTILIIALLLVLYSRRFGSVIFNIIRKLPKLKNLQQEFLQNFYSIQISKKRITCGFIVALAIWFFDGFALYLVLLAFNVSISPYVAMGIVALSIMIGVASSLPGGLGSTEIVMILLLNAAGVANPVAVTSVFIYRFVTVWYGFALGFSSLIYLSKKINLKEIKLQIS